MIHLILKKFADGPTPEIKFVKGWKDDYSNVISVFQIGGKRYCFLSTIGSPKEFHHCFGVGSSGTQTNAPVGKGNYLIGDKIEVGYADALSDLISSGNLQFEPLHNNIGASWAPGNESQKSKLADLVSIYAGLNRQLEQLGILYAEGDKLIFGKDLHPEDVTNWATKTGPQHESTHAPPQSQQSSGGNTPALTQFLSALAPEFKKEFGQDMVVGSTHRTPAEQAEAMRWTIPSGNFDKIYSPLPEYKRIKDLVQSQRWDEAGEIIAKYREWMRLPHLTGRGADIPFGRNPILSSKEHARFRSLVQRVSDQVGIPATVNFEKENHFHITIA